MMSVRRCGAVIAGVCLTLSLLTGSALAGPMGLGPDAREAIEAWSKGLGLKVKAVTIAVDHAALDLDGCSIYLAHDTGSRCSGLFMDVGGARACLSSTQCIEWSDFQQSLERAGGVYPPWHAVEMMPEAATGGEGEFEIPRDFEVALRAMEDGLVWLEPQRAKAIFSGLLDREKLTFSQQLSFLPAAARLGLGGLALSRLGSGVWLSADIRLSTVVRMALIMGPQVAVSVAEALLDEASACGAVPIGRSFARVGEFAAAAALGRLLRRQDVKCFEAYSLEIGAAYQAGERQAVADAFYEARARFSGDPRIPALQLIALRATGQWRAAKFVLDQRIASGKATSDDLALLVRVLAHEPLKSEAIIALKARLDAKPLDPVASFVLGAMAHLDKDYAGSYSLLKTAAKGQPGQVGYLHTLQALNAISLGDMTSAKAALKRALERSPRDPETHWAVAEVVRDDEPLVAGRSLEIGLRLLPHRAMHAVRMTRQRDALRSCDGKSPCKGPWRYRVIRSGR
jgi:hypothetical protein